MIEYDNGGNTQQAVYISDVHFDSIPIASNDDVIQAGDGDDVVFAGEGDDSVDGGSGADTLHGGAGADTLDGGTGNDTIHVGDGDSAIGGDGDDTFFIDPAELDGGTLTIVGGEGAEGIGDTLDFNDQLVKGSIVYTNDDDDAGGLSGTATLLDGTVVTFSEIETIICFCDDAMILTPQGLRSIKDIQVGDDVITRDRGPQAVRWVGRREISGTGALAPIRFAPGSLGNKVALSVSPQHRMLIQGYRAELLFGEREVLVAAKHLVNDSTVRQVEEGPVTYHHILFDDHEVVQANGVWSESYQPGSHSLPSLDPQAREELFTVFPELRWNPGGFGRAARTSVNRREGMLLAS